MTTYRTGNHWGVTIVREGEHGGDCFDTCNGHPGAQLVAVVVNGDQALAERICALLNREETVDRVIVYPQTDARRGYPPRGGAPSGPAISPQAAQNGPAVPSATPNDLSGSEGRFWGEHPAHSTCIDITTIECPKRCTCLDTAVSTNQPDPACPRHGAVS